MVLRNGLTFWVNLDITRKSGGHGSYGRADAREPGRFTRLPWLLALTLGLVSAGCSSFNKEWKAAGFTPTPVTDIEGRWDGTWLSHTNGHHGRLRCLMTERADGQFVARFHANYLKILTFNYSVPLIVRQTNGVFEFSGGAPLGKLAGGHYEYDGRATPTNFFSNYKAKSDGGIFEMSRPPDKPKK